MTKDEALRLALEALESGEKMQNGRLVWIEHDTSLVKQAIPAIKDALEAKDEIDWKDMYEKQKRHSEMWVAKYEKDIGPLEKAVPHQKAKDAPL